MIPLPFFKRAGLLGCANQHRVSEIAAVYRGSAPASQGQRKVRRAAAKVEDARLGPVQNKAETPCNAAAPKTVERERKNMVQEIVPGSDATKHFADSRRGFLLSCDALRARAGGGGLRGCLRCGIHSAVFARPNSSRQTSAIRSSGNSLPICTLPIRFASTNLNLPSRVFLSQRMAATRLFGGM